VFVMIPELVLERRLGGAALRDFVLLRRELRLQLWIFRFLDGHLFLLERTVFNSASSTALSRILSAALAALWNDNTPRRRPEIRRGRHRCGPRVPECYPCRRPNAAKRTR